MKYLLLIIFSLQFIYSCTKLRESAGVERKNLDEFQIIENPPLVIPPDFNLLPPEQLKKKEIENVEKELAEEILFGLNETISEDADSASPMGKILKNTDADIVDSNIRDEIDEFFANEVKTKGLFESDWENQNEVLNAVEESERIRNKTIKGENLSEEQIIIPKEESNKQKKKKRFFFF